MSELTLIAVSLGIFLLIYLTVRGMPEWFLATNYSMPRLREDVETDCAERNKLRIAEEALCGPSYAAGKLIVSKCSARSSKDLMNGTETSNLKK